MAIAFSLLRNDDPEKEYVIINWNNGIIVDANVWKFNDDEFEDAKKVLLEECGEPYGFAYKSWVGPIETGRTVASYVLGVVFNNSNMVDTLKKHFKKT